MCRAAPPSTVAGHRRPSPATVAGHGQDRPPPPLCAREMRGERGTGLGLQGAPTADGFVRARSADDRPMQIRADRRLQAAGAVQA
jgi:hypothetical protein